MDAYRFISISLDSCQNCDKKVQVEGKVAASGRIGVVSRQPIKMFALCEGLEPDWTCFLSYQEMRVSRLWLGKPLYKFPAGKMKISLLKLFEVSIRREKEDIRRRNSNFMSTFSSLLILEIFRI